MMTNRRSRLACAAVVLTLGCAVEAGEPVITNLGSLPGGENSRGWALNSDGSIVVGEAGTPDGWRAFLWTAAEGMLDLGVLPMSDASSASGVSDDGAVVVGQCESDAGNLAFRWTPELGMQPLPTPEGWRSLSANGVSDDGRIIVGTMFHDSRQWVACRWVDGGVAEVLGVLEEGNVTTAQAVSGDGAVVTGWGRVGEESRVFLWSEPAGIRDLGLPEGTMDAGGHAVSDDGTTVVGIAWGPGGGAFRWRADEGWRFLYDIPPPRLSYATGLTATGTAVVGGTWSYEYGTPPFYWREDIGIVLLFSGALGLDLSGWTLTGVNGVTPDGTSLVGSGWDGTGEVAFLITGLPRVDALCMPDFTGDGVLDMFDLQDFLGRYADGSADADFASDGVLDFFDLQAFLNAFAAGCG